MPARTQLPEGKIIPRLAGATATVAAIPASALVTHRAPLPYSWDLCTPDRVADALYLLLGGHVTQRSAHTVCTALQLAQQPGVLIPPLFWPSAPATHTGALSPHAGTWNGHQDLPLLLSAVRFGCSPGFFFDPAPCGAGLSQALAACGLTLAAAGDALQFTQPGSYLSMAQRPHIIISAPPVRLLDLMLPLSTRFALAAVCCYVPRSWIAGACPARASWLRRLRREGRLLIIAGDGAAPMQGAWLLIFTSTHAQTLLCTSVCADCSTLWLSA